MTNQEKQTAIQVCADALRFDRFNPNISAEEIAAKVMEALGKGDAVAIAQYKFPYQRTFDAIAAATDVLKGPPQSQLSISVQKFQAAFNRHRDARPLAALSTTGEPKLDPLDNSLTDSSTMGFPE